MFAEKSIEFTQECAALGLFEARPPRFSQLFFYNFTDSETNQLLGQSESGGAVSRRAAEAYLLSGVRLESSCGMSDAWYNYVESNSRLFTRPDPLDPPSLSRSPLFPPSQPSPHPRPNSQQLESIGSTLNWRKVHSRPRPTKKPGRALEDHPDDCSEDGPLNNTISPSSTTLAYRQCLTDATCRDDAHRVETGEEEDGMKEPSGAGVEQDEGALGSPMAVAEQGETDVSSDEYQFSDSDDWPTTASFEGGMGELLNRADLDASKKPVVSVIPPSGATVRHAPYETLGPANGQTSGAGTSGKRARQDSNTCEGS